MLSSFLVACLATSSVLVKAAPSGQPRAKRALTTTDASSISGRSFDYVIAGGGLAGSVLARRLAESGDGSGSVLVIEAGVDAEDQEVIYSAGAYQQAFDGPYDWAYKTVPQNNGAVETLRAGKCLGGSTAINGLAWSKPHTFQIDAMETVGNQGLNWDSLQAYMLKAENFAAPSDSRRQAGLTYDASCHAENGPINIEFDPAVTPSDLERNFNSTVVGTLGLPYATDLTCGDPASVAPIANTRNGDTRVDAYRGYLYQQDIPNLTILTGAQVGRVLLSSDSTPNATGVEYQDGNGNTYTVNANLEVIMAAGSIRTPQILQHSGVGPSDVLSAAGVQQRVDLPIGLNLIDQTTVTTDWNFSGQRGGGQVITFPRFQDLVTGSDAQTLRDMLDNNLATYAQQAVDAGAFNNATALEIVLGIQRDWILNQGAGISESFDYSFGSTLGYDSWYLLPFGRGSIKIQDSNAYGGGVSIDPRYFSNEFDQMAQAATARYTRTVSSTNPLTNNVQYETVPGGSVGDDSLSSWAKWSQANYRSNWHPIGTASMMSRELGGSVDSSNRVYGINNLRVVDGSILPFQVSSHLMSVLYGLAERAAELIKADHTGNTPTPPPTSEGVQIHPNGNTGKCLDVGASTPSNGSPVDVYDCSSARSQQQSWTLARGSTQVQLAGTNFCLDATSGKPGDGQKMKIWQCYEGLAAQTWYYTDDNRIAVQDSGKCLDVTDGSTSNGNVMQVWSCSSGNNNQVWTTTSSQR